MGLVVRTDVAAGPHRRSGHRHGLRRDPSNGPFADSHYFRDTGVLSDTWAADQQCCRRTSHRDVHGSPGVLRALVDVIRLRVTPSNSAR